MKEFQSVELKLLLCFIPFRGILGKNLCLIETLLTERNVLSKELCKNTTDIFMFFFACKKWLQPTPVNPDTKGTEENRPDTA